MDFIEDIRKEVSKVIPPDELWGERISYDRLSEYLGMHTRYLRDTRNRIKNANNPKYNPNFKFAEEQLRDFIKSLSNKLGDADITGCVEIILKYMEKNNLREYQLQQWHLHNPELKYNFFKVLDKPIKGYYFGLLLSDGNTFDGKVGLWLEKEDVEVVKRFREHLCISNKLEYRIDKRQKKQSGEYPERYSIRVGCKPMINDLNKLGFKEFKEGSPLKDGFFTSLRHDIALSILLGFYDGDGEEGAPIIHSTNKEFLEQIKKEFNIRYDLQLKKKGKIGDIVLGQESDTKDQWYLRIRPELFNKMMESYEPSMERKREYYPLKTIGNRYAFDVLVEKLGNKKALEELTLIGPKTRLAKAFGCSFDLFKRLCDKYDIKTLPHSYWKREENKNWELDLDKKIEEYKDKYLGDRP